MRLLTRSDLASMAKLYLGARSLAERVEKSDLKSLRQLRHALTENLSISHYAQLPDAEVQSMLQAVNSALALLEPKPRKQRRPRVKKEPTPLDVSWSYESDLFHDLARWPRRPYCTNDFEAGLRIRPLRQAIAMTHIQCNRPGQCAWIIFDIDRPGAEHAWHEAGLCEPTWIAVNRKNGHAHAAYGLRVPVMVAGLGAKNAPMRYLASIEAMMRDKLGADPGYSGLITKNPLHTDWCVIRGPRMTYDLCDLAETLPGIAQYIPKKREVDQGGVGRNVSLFDQVCQWAYRAIRPFWGSGLGGWNGWKSLCNSRALVLNCNFSQPLSGKEVWQIAKSVAKYCWKCTTLEGFSAWQAVQGAKGGTASGKVRRDASEGKRASAKLMAAAGQSSRTIGAALGVDQSTVIRWLRG